MEEASLCLQPHGVGPIWGSLLTPGKSLTNSSSLLPAPCPVNPSPPNPLLPFNSQTLNPPQTSTAPEENPNPIAPLTGSAAALPTHHLCLP